MSATTDISRATVNTISLHWGDMPAEQRAENIKSLCYIKELAGRTNTNISRWRVGAIFTVEGTANLVSSPNEINRRFFEKKVNLSDEDVEVPELSPNFFESVQSTMRNAHVDKINTAEHEYDSAVRRLNENTYAHERLLQNMIKAKDLVRRLKAPLDSANMVLLKSDLQQALLEGFYGDMLMTRDGTIWLVTAEIVIVLRNRAAAQDLSVNLGKMVVGFNMSSGLIKVVPYKNNRTTSCGDDVGWYHPHVHKKGKPCWGDALPQATTAMSEWRPLQMLRLLHSVLTNYNPDNPYFHLDRISNDLLSMKMELPTPDVSPPHIERDRLVEAGMELPLANARTYVVAISMEVAEE